MQSAKNQPNTKVLCRCESRDFATRQQLFGGIWRIYLNRICGTQVVLGLTLFLHLNGREVERDCVHLSQNSFHVN